METLTRNGEKCWHVGGDQNEEWTDEHEEEAETAVQLLLPWFRVETVGDTLVEVLNERTFLNVKYHHLKCREKRILNCTNDCQIVKNVILRLIPLRKVYEFGANDTHKTSLWNDLDANHQSRDPECTVLTSTPRKLVDREKRISIKLLENFIREINLSSFYLIWEFKPVFCTSMDRIVKNVAGIVQIYLVKSSLYRNLILKSDW